jgi:membrane fusion protein (multidrug efflux system)
MPMLVTPLLLLALGATVVACTGGSDKAKLPPPKPTAAVTNAPADAATPAATPTPTPLEVQPGQPKADVVVSQPQSGAQELQYRLTGEVASIRRSQLAFRVTGFVSQILAKPGTVVTKGTPLATLDDRDFIIAVEMAKANRDQAAIAQSSALKEFRREQQLKKENASTATVFEKMQAAHDQARLALRSAELNLEKAELALKDAQLIAPYDCVVAKQMKHEGENIQSGNAVFEVYDTAEPEITLSAPERLMGTLVVGSRLNVTVPAAGYSGQAEIVRMVPIISDKTRTFDVTAKLSNYDRKIVPGLFAEATLVN